MHRASGAELGCAGTRAERRRAVGRRAVGRCRAGRWEGGEEAVGPPSRPSVGGGGGSWADGEERSVPPSGPKPGRERRRGPGQI